MPDTVIQTEGLSQRFGSQWALQEVSVSITPGAIGLLGPNGAGKSTTMKLLTGYISPSEGVARIAGHDMATDRLAGSTRLGYLPENGPLYPDMTPSGLLDFFADARGVTGSEKRERIDAVADICALSTVFHKPISKLSKGYRQRVGMAQALLHEPDVLIMDEPTAGLDPNQIAEVRNTMQKLGKARTILLSTHILQEVEALASRVIVINEGRIVADGPIEEFTTSGKALNTEFKRLTAISS